eukprot:CAMPEP_0185708948 /NCGR_PEP_ID=MMETSP1164-20130828/27630_1 /TAXON_ID=1104430 /ORGANISM="Chrysoreinhardia sp, Strain CCMP2950" /LENGTH=42 /DNA_ID= /DNA_START= /DNA_END= /DNA_ORIENTATION=
MIPSTCGGARDGGDGVGGLAERERGWDGGDETGAEEERGREA